MKNRIILIVAILSLIIGIIIGTFIPKEKLDTELILGTYQNYVECTEELLTVIEEAEIKGDNFTIVKEESDVYKEYCWLLNIILQNSYQNIKTDSEILQDYSNYYEQTEALLDSIYSWDENYWLDVISETDTYLFYEEIKANLNK